MPRRPEALSRMEVLVLSTLVRRPMHGYELMLELRYKHVRWWAKCEHGHVYATLARLAKRGDLKEASRSAASEGQRVFSVTASGQKRLRAFLSEICSSPDQTYFDVDLFLAGAFVLDKEGAIALLEQRGTVLKAQLAEARAIEEGMQANVPTVARLIMEHRTEHLGREIAFTKTCIRALRAEKKWGPFLGNKSIVEFVRRTKVPVEDRQARES